MATLRSLGCRGRTGARESERTHSGRERAGHMWNWMNRSEVRPLSEVVRRILLRERGLNEVSAGGLRMALKKGLYAGRQVTYFRVFDPAALLATGQAPQHFRDLDGSGALYAGHIEREGHVVLI